jgi:virginiamycin B lyase
MNHNKVYSQLVLFVTVLVLMSTIHQSTAQLSSLSNPPNVSQQFVTYQKNSNFIHEFNVPINQRGLKGVVTDSQGNPWFYHQTDKSSTIMKFNLANNSFISYPVQGKTVADTPVINLAGGQMIYDQKRNSIWFTDARINALGNINLKNDSISLYKIPTNNSGIMGILLSPDNNSIWFAEIIGNKIGSFDISSKHMVEYPTGDFTGPTLLTFDKKGQLWVTLSYSHGLLKVQPWLLVPESRAGGMTEIMLNKPDTFSPFGIVIVNDRNNVSKMFASDHGSSRVIFSNVSSELKNYTSYWTSPSQAYPASLPSQVISDKFGNVYFPEHGGNKISKISATTGEMTEYDIPTGPLATVVYIAVSPDASKVWFTEWASNMLAYLDTAIPIPLEMRIKDPTPITLKANQTHPIDIQVSKTNTTANPLLSLNGIELSLIGMTDSGLQGLTYVAKPQRFNITETPNLNGTLDLTVDAKDAIAAKYTIMPRLSTPEKDNLTVSLLEPQTLTLDVPAHKAQLQNFTTLTNNENSNSPFILLRDIARYAAIGVAVTLIGYLVYRKIKQRKLKRDTQ